jgi:hypothetical protein
MMAEDASALRKGYASRDAFDIEMSAANLKAAVKKVDRSAAAVEVALKGLMAASGHTPLPGVVR